MPFPKALPAPGTPVTIMDDALIDRAVAASRESPRGRIILPLHKSGDAALQRMFNAMQPGSYIQPHRHLAPPKDESIVVLRGAVGVFLFDESGEVTQSIRLAARSAQVGFDVTAGVYHTFCALEPDTVVFEVKAGPFAPLSAEDFASWAPAEGDSRAASYLEELVAGLSRQP